MIQVCTPFSSFGNVWTVSKFWTPHDETLRGKTKSRNSPANKARSAWFARFAWSARSASLHFSMTVVAWMRARESHLCDLKWIFSGWILDSFFSEILDSKSWILESGLPYIRRNIYHRQAIWKRTVLTIFVCTNKNRATLWSISFRSRRKYCDFVIDVLSKIW